VIKNRPRRPGSGDSVEGPKAIKQLTSQSALGSKLLGILIIWMPSGLRAAASRRSTQAGRSPRLGSALLRRLATVRRKIGSPHLFKSARASGRRAHVFSNSIR
jgi:hypothetical protein